MKSVSHFRLQNERDVLLRFQNRSPFIRPLLDEIETANSPHSLVLRYLDDDILRASDTKRFTRLEVKYVARRVLKALAVLHEEEFVHTGTLFRVTSSAHFDPRFADGNRCQAKQYPCELQTG